MSKLFLRYSTALLQLVNKHLNMDMNFVLSSSESDSSDSTSSEDDLEELLQDEHLPKNQNYILETVQAFTDIQFMEHFRVGRAVANEISVRFEQSDMFHYQSGGNEKISALHQVYIFLWYAGHEAASFRDVGDRFNISISSLFRIIRRLIYFLSNLSPEVIRWPQQQEQQEIEQFYRDKRFPGIIGALDGSHIRIDRPERDPDSYYNRKKYFSIQTDYSRHLDEIARELERVCLEVIQKFLVESKNGDALRLIQHWETYRQVSGAPGSSMDEEIKLFLRKICKLEEILHLLTEHTDLVSHLGERLQKISLAIKKEGSLNAGGKFEWVDSVLIKCLQDGSWLLVDNVNLCSSAVLDRLNALLEPNGVLTVSERGVDCDGQMVEIKPHKDFRLFLTMDPKNGEISRAMRNRGIEIYLLSETEFPNPQNIDQSSLIQLEGLNSFHAEILINLHNFISELIIGEKPTIHELIQVSTLAAQQLKYGVDTNETFLDAILEVYYKTRSVNEFTCNDFPRSIRDIISKLLNEETITTLTCFDKNATLRTQNLSENSELEKIKQQSVLLFKHLETQVKSVHDINLELGYHLVCFYSLASCEDFRVRHMYLREKVEYEERLNDDVRRMLLNIIESFLKTILSCIRRDCNIPLDHNWTPEIIPKQSILKSNTVTLLLLYNIHYFIDNVKLINRSESRVLLEGRDLIFSKPRKGSKFTLLEYARLVQKELIEDRFNDVIIHNFTNLNTAYDNFMTIVLGSISEISNEDVIGILYMLFWKSKLFEIFQFDLSIDMKKNELRKIFGMLPVHYKWFYKFSVQAVAGISGIPVHERLNEILTKINSKLDKQFSIMHKLGKNFQKSSKRPPPFTNKEQFEIVRGYNEISEQYDTSRKGNDMVNVFNILKQKKELRSALVEFKSELDYGFNDASRKHELVSNIKDYISSKVSNGYTKFELQLLPILDTFAHLETRKNISMENSTSLVNNILIPTELSGAMALYSRTKDERLLHEINKSYYMYLMNSPSVRPSKFLGAEEDVELNEFGPKLTYFLNNLLVNAKGVEDLRKVTLGNFRDLMKQHDLLNLILWGNICQLSDEKYSFIYREKKNVMVIYSKFLSELAQALKTKTDIEDTDSPQKLTQIILIKLKELEDSDPSTEVSILSEKLKECVNRFEEFSNISEFEQIIIAISYFYQTISYLKAKFNSRMSTIDPLAKKTLKRKYCLEAKSMFEMLKVCYENLNRIYSGRKKTRHAYCEPIEGVLMELQVKHEELSKYVAYRPDDVLYENVCDVINHAFSTLLSEDFVVEVDDSSRERTINERSNKVASYENLIHELSQFRSSFPDIIEPLLSNVSEFLYGFKLYLSALKMQDAKMKQSSALARTNSYESLISLTKFPFLYEDRTCDLLVMNKVVKHFLEDAEQPYIQEQENFRLLKCAIIESVNFSITHSQPSDILSKDDFSRFNDLLDLFVNAYNKQQEQNEIKKKEEESLYKIKTKCDDKSEEEQIKEDLQQLFPNYHTIDFADFEKTVDIEDPPDEEIETKYEEVISYNDLKDVTQLHVDLLSNYTKTEWLNPTKKKALSPDFILPLLEKFKTFSKILEKTMDSVDYRMDEDLIGSLNVLLAVKKRYDRSADLTDGLPSHGKISQKKYDFYRDSNVEEAKSCYHILEELKIKINELLDEWTDQPTLSTIVTVIDRIYKFEITSPISRFLTGFEILLSKCHEWEEVAHSGVSLNQFALNLTNQIITWRKMELSMWKDLLTRVYERLNGTLPKWWLHLFNVMYQFVTEKKFKEQELIETLQTFMTKSTLAEYHGRLDLLYAFHCHATYLERTTETESFISILWNVYVYFKQFEELVFKQIKDLRTPIEKKLKDYVKIVRWKDINYWAIKDTVEKSHKNLHKFMRDFQQALEQPVLPCLHNTGAESGSQNVGIWDKTQKEYYTNQVLEITSYLNEDARVKKMKRPAKEVIRRLNHQAVKVYDYSKEIILATSYPESVRVLELFLTDVIETSSHLQNLEIDATLPKEKQKSQAKNILQQKHRALADLFKNLSKIGLSFKTGIIDSKTKNPISDFIIKPIDLTSEFSHANYGYKEESMLSMWESSEKYYVRSLMRLDVLDTALKTPSKELGMHNAERLKGFSQDILTTVQRQKIELVESSRIYYYLRHYTKQIKEFCESTEYLPSELVNNITDILTNISTIMSQYQIILNTCPEESTFNAENFEIPILKSNLDKRVTYKQDEMWCKAANLISSIQTLCSKLTAQFLKSKAQLPSTEYELLSKKYVPVKELNKINNDLTNIKVNIMLVKEIFGNIALTKSLTLLEEKIEVVVNDIKESDIKGSCVESDIPYDFEQEIDKFSGKIMFIVKKLRKKYRQLINSPSEEPEENKDKLKDEHLKKLLVENLLNDVSDLDMTTMLEETHKIVTGLMGSSLEKVGDRTTLAAEVRPNLEQFVLLYRYFVTQQVSAYRISCKMSSVLLNIFIELASKGFCIPPEFADELDKEGVSKPSDGLGLGEGQGERDVSDKIESEDQLDDAQPAGKERDAEDDTDCKEEEKGIEMSEDFESKLQDKEKKEEDDSDSDSGDSNADEQMGDTEKGADQQNKETFGDEEDEQEEQEGGSEQKEEKGEKGEKEGEEQLSAKEGKTCQDDEEQTEGKEEKEKNKKEINEMEEPEYDDEQVDPHHGQQQELPEPEPMDLPEDMQLDDGEANDEENENQEENPFDIDTLKTEDKPEDKTDDTADENRDEESKKDDEKDFSSDDEDIERGDKKEGEDEGSAEDDNNKESDNLLESGEPENEDDAKSEHGDESVLDQTQSYQENIEAMQVDDAEAADKAQANKSENQQSNEPIQELQQEDRPDKEGVGQSQMEESSSGHSAQTSAPQEIKATKDNKNKEEQKRKEKPGETDSRRSLGDVDQPVRKKLKTVDAKNEEMSTEKDEKMEETADMYQHIKDAEKTKSQVLDVATKEQAENQKKETQHEENNDEELAESATDLPQEDEPEVIDVEDTQTEKPEKTGEAKDKQNKKQQHPQGDILEELQDIDIEGEVIETTTVSRSAESSHHTQYSTIRETTATRLSVEEINNLRLDVEKQLSGWNEPPSTLEADQAWQKISSVTSSLAQDFSEQLRLVLEPTQASRLRGDFRTGRRINMRKVIPYIASQFRKDKIWLRRTKPSKREYQIVLAIDDSSSMADNHSKELAFESVALISKALSLLESGQLSVLSFGENVEVIHKLTDQFTDKSGIKLLQKFKFGQNQTCVAKLADFATEMFNQFQLHSTALNAKLLVIVSDGRGVFSEGEAFVKQAVRRAKLSNIFMVFVIIDSPENKNSVLDIRMPVFKDGKLVEIQNYMDAFPFSFYIILRDINSLPSVLSDALRQWFEIVSNLDK